MNIVIAGLGVIGGSFAMALKSAGYNDVFGIDTDRSTLKKAKDAGIIKEGFTEGKDILADCDLVILSIYPKQVKEFLDSNKNCFKPGAVITDTAGIKCAYFDEIMKSVPDNVDFVLGHPMAGREKRGIDFASPNVFKGANYIITPTEKNKAENIDLIENIVYEIGFGCVKRISTILHDEIIGYTSQLPHVMAVALVNSDNETQDTYSFAGNSYRELTRIANINEELWCELFFGNKNNLLKAIDNFEEQMSLIKTAIIKEDYDSLKEYFIKSTMRCEKQNI